MSYRAIAKSWDQSDLKCQTDQCCLEPLRPTTHSQSVYRQPRPLKDNRRIALQAELETITSSYLALVGIPRWYPATSHRPRFRWSMQRAIFRILLPIKTPT